MVVVMPSPQQQYPSSGSTAQPTNVYTAGLPAPRRGGGGAGGGGGCGGWGGVGGGGVLGGVRMRGRL